VLHAPVRDRAAIVGLRFGARRRDAAKRSLGFSLRTLQERSARRAMRLVFHKSDLVDRNRRRVSDVYRPGRVLRLEPEGGTVSMEEPRCS
jgi:hypothetical protein